MLVSLPALGSEKAGLVRWPVFLPDGRHFLFFALPDTVAVGSLDSTEGKKLLQADSHAVYASGYLLFQRQGTLLAQPFDTGRLELTGEAIPVAEQLGVPASAFGRFSVSDTGVLVHRSDAEFSTELRWFDRQGTSKGTVGPESLYINPVISPDGSQVMVGRRDRIQPTFDLWLFDLARNLSSRLTFDPGTEWLPLWSPDRKYIAYTMDRRTGKHDLYRRLANGAGEDELVFASDYNKNLTDWTLDGQFLIFDEGNRPGHQRELRCGLRREGACPTSTVRSMNRTVTSRRMDGGSPISPTNPAASRSMCDPFRTRRAGGGRSPTRGDGSPLGSRRQGAALLFR